MIHHVTDLERQQAAEIERLLGGIKRYEEMAAMASAEIADLTAEIERLRAALLSVTNALDKMGDMLDGDVSPRAWRSVDAENLITLARAAMKEQQ